MALLQKEGGRMRYLWSGYVASDEFRLPPDGCLSVPAFEEQHAWKAGDGHRIREVNPLPRFASVFEPILEELSELAETPQDARTMAQTKELATLVNLACHLLAQTDRTSGIHRTTLLTWRIDHDVRAGVYGAEAAQIYREALTADERRRIAMLLCRQEALGQPLFHAAAPVLFPGMQLYFHTEDGVWLVATPQAGTADDLARERLLEHLFSALGDRVRFFWDMPFGIVGERRTMRLGAMRMV